MEQLRNRDMAKFHYCSYWRNWSRVLHEPGQKHENVELPEFEQRSWIEVNLTPIPCCHDSSWEGDVAPIRIRRHGTMRDRHDKEVDELPREVYEKMLSSLDIEVCVRLLIEDFLPQIDWEKYEKARNGGANLEDVVR